MQDNEELMPTIKERKLRVTFFDYWNGKTLKQKGLLVEDQLLARRSTQLAQQNVV